MTKFKIFLLRWGLAILMMVAIFGFSSIPSKEMPTFGLFDFSVKKGGHALGYGLLALAFWRGLRWEKRDSSKSVQTMWIAWAMAVAYSATDEFHQSFVPGRHPAVTDVMIDATGAALMLFLVNRYFGHKITKSSAQDSVPAVGDDGSNSFKIK